MADTNQTLPPPDHHVGFFERRWRMVKAAAKQAYNYLFDIKTYIGAAVMFGGIAALKHGMPHNETVQWVTSVFNMSDKPGVAEIALRAAKLIGFSTLVRTGIAMAKESYQCNDCHTGQVVPDMVEGIKQAQQLAQSVEQHYGYDYLGQSQQFTPPANLPKPAPGQQTILPPR